MVLLQRRNVALVAAAAALLSGCVVVPAEGRHDGRYGGPSTGGYSAPGPDVPDGVVVGVAPPPVPVEVLTPAPGPGYFWIGGYWTWHLGRHLWIGGRWAPHRSGWVYAPHRWYPHGHGWRQSPGYWRRR
jgi:WXXGXW repeat (2 copies)